MIHPFLPSSSSSRFFQCIWFNVGVVASEHVLLLAAVVIINHTSRTHLQLIAVHPHRHPCAHTQNTQTHFLLDPRARPAYCYHCCLSSSGGAPGESIRHFNMFTYACAYLEGACSLLKASITVASWPYLYHRRDPCFSIQKQSRNKCIFLFHF